MVVLLSTATAFAQAPANRAVMPGMRLVRPLAGPPAAPAASGMAAAPAVSAAPSAPLPLSQRPANPPQVSYQSGMLTIVADNSVLGDILREVHRCTGAAIEVPPNATERVVTRIGPGPARDVLAELLNGSSFNYVMVGSESDPTILSRVMLTTRPDGGVGNSGGSVYQPQQAYVPPQQSLVPAPGTGPGGAVVQQPASDDEADADEEDKDEDDSGDDTQAAGPGAQNQEAQPPDGSQPNAGPRTPEQILEMLRQRPNMVQQPGQPLMHPPGQQQPQPDDNNN